MTTTATLQSVTDFLAETPARVRRLVQNLSARDARWKPSPQEFSALEQVCHLRDLEREGYAVRIEKLIREDQPHLPDFDGARIAAERRYHAQSLSDALDTFARARESNMRAIGALAPVDLRRGGTLEGVGPVTLEEVLGKMREHDEGHLQELNALLTGIERAARTDL